MRETIKLERAALDETPNGEIILRGVLTPDSLKLIQADTYQREVLPITSVTSLVEAFKSGGKVPDVTLGMRGGNFSDRAGSIYLLDDVYVIDGLQRQSTALHLMRSGECLAPHLGAIVYFNTTHESEADLFRILNTSRAKLSPNVLIRNLRESNPAVEALHGLTEESTFVMYDRVCWQQQMRRHELITGSTLLQLAGHIHGSFAPALTGGRWAETARALALLVRDRVRTRTFLQNIRTFFDVIERSYGIRSVAYKGGAAYLHGSFLLSLALVFAQHRMFWSENYELQVPIDIRRKLSTFALKDPMVRTICGGGRAKDTLVQLIINHLNSGRRTRRLVPFKAITSQKEKEA